MYVRSTETPSKLPPPLRIEMEDKTTMISQVYRNNQVFPKINLNRIEPVVLFFKTKQAPFNFSVYIFYPDTCK